MKMVQERADIEERYARSLESWRERWIQSVTKGNEESLISLLSGFFVVGSFHTFYTFNTVTLGRIHKEHLRTKTCLSQISEAYII